MTTIEPAGADAALITFDEAPSAVLSARITQLAQALAAELGDALIDQIPGWDTLLLHYRLERLPYPLLEQQVRALLDAPVKPTAAAEVSVCHHMPVWYAGEDLVAVAEQCGLSPAEVIQLHTGTDYFVGAVGFVPGFAYLGGGDKRLALPRRASPRTQVPQGSVAITEQQSAIYPQQVPGGWHLIGRCPLSLYDATRASPARFRVGDRVRFIAIDEAEFHACLGQWEWPKHAGREE